MKIPSVGQYIPDANECAGRGKQKKIDSVADLTFEANRSTGERGGQKYGTPRAGN